MNQVVLNTSAWVINDTLLACHSPQFPPDLPKLLDLEWGPGISPLTDVE
jgi:hypothetical protein